MFYATLEMVQGIDGVKQRFEALGARLDERSRRLVVAAESLSLGRGGISAVSRATGISRPVIRDGVKELTAPVPNAAFDLLVPPLLGVLSLERATQCFLTFYLLVFATGCHWMGRAVRGGGSGFGLPHFAILPCLFLSYQAAFLYGYLNYSAGLALAILTLALRIGWAGRWTILRLARLTFLRLAVYLFHLSAIAILGLGWIVWSIWEGRLAGRARWWAIGSFAAFIPADILYLQTDRGGASTIYWPTSTQKVLHLLGGFTSYSLPITGLAIVLGGGTLAVALWLSWRTFLQPVGAAGVVFLALYLAAPDAFHKATDTDTRFVAPALLLLTAACLFPSPSFRSASVLLGLSLTAMTVRQIDIINHWRVASGEWTAQLASLDAVPQGSVLHWVVWTDPDPLISKRERHFHNFAALAASRRQVEIANFASYTKGTWPLSMQPAYTYCHLAYGEPVAHLDWNRLRAEKAFLWTYGLTAQALGDMAALAKPVYSSGRVNVFRVSAAVPSDDREGPPFL